MLFRIVDIETVPDFRIWQPGKPRWELTPLPDGQAGASLMDQFPPPHAHRVVAIASADIRLNASDSSQPRYLFEGCRTACHWGYGDDADTDERSLLVDFGAQATSASDLNLVTWNGRTFDLPVMAMRAFQLGIPWGWYYSDRDMRYRYSAEGHLDLMDFLSDYGAGKNMKLADVARMMGLPGKVDITGASVDGLYRGAESKSPAERGEIQEHVGRYCLQDVIETAAIYLRTRFHLGKIGASDYNKSIEKMMVDPLVQATLPFDWSKLLLETP
jgi:3'-5' exonuclease